MANDIDKLIESNSEGQDEIRKDIMSTRDALEQKLTDILTSLKAFKVDIPKEISVTNLREVPKTERVRVTNLEDIKIPEQRPIDLSELTKIKTVLNDIAEELKIDKLPTSAKNPVPVRLSDGSRFYKALDMFVATSGGGGSQPSFQLDTGDPHRGSVVQVYNGRYAVVVTNPDGTSIGSSTPTGTQDVNLIKVGGTAFSLGQQLAAASLPVVLTAAQISTLTPLSTVAVTQSTSPWVVSATNLDIRDLAFATDSVAVYGSEGVAIQQKATSNDLIVTLDGETITISGSVTANAGTNLNTSLLALESGGNLATIAGKDFATQTTLAAVNAKLVSGTDIGDVTINNASGGSAVNIQDGGNTITVDNGGTFPVQESALTSVGSFQKTVTTAGTRVQLDTNTSKSVTIKAKTTNTGLIYVGNVAVTSSNGFILSAGDTISLDISNTNLVYIDSSVDAEGVSVAFAN